MDVFKMEVVYKEGRSTKRAIRMVDTVTYYDCTVVFIKCDCKSSITIRDVKMLKVDDVVWLEDK
jgi:hypothetical protein